MVSNTSVNGAIAECWLNINNQKNVLAVIY